MRPWLPGSEQSTRICTTSKAVLHSPSKVTLNEEVGVRAAPKVGEVLADRQLHGAQPRVCDHRHSIAVALHPAIVVRAR